MISKNPLGLSHESPAGVGAVGVGAVGVGAVGVTGQADVETKALFASNGVDAAKLEQAGLLQVPSPTNAVGAVVMATRPPALASAITKVNVTSGLPVKS